MLLSLVWRFIDCYVVCGYAEYCSAECHYEQCHYIKDLHVSLRVNGT